ncbi:MAG: disulfide bond formation protein B [Pseudomonadota bacterium]
MDRGPADLHNTTMQIWGSLVRDWRWPLWAAGLSFVILLIAHGFERFGNMPPCNLCLRQREVYWALISMSLVGVFLWFVRPNPRFIAALNVLIGLVFITGAVVAGFHAGVEYGWWPAPEGCTAGAATDEIMGAILGETLDEGPLYAPGCTEPPWAFILSMAGWNMVLSLGLAGLSFLAARTSHASHTAGMPGLAA